MKNLKSTSLFKTNNIKDAITLLNKIKTKIVLIVNSKFQLLGTVNDGDIRRVLALGKSMNVKLSKVMNDNPVIVKEGTKLSKINYLMKTNSIMQIPELNKNNKVIKLHFWNQPEIERKKNIFFILAGGFGKRLRPLTKNTPKPMLKISNKPILEHIILNAINYGFINFQISLFFKKDKIIKYFDKKKYLKNMIKYLIEKKPLGTAGSLKLIKSKTNEPIVVVNGDVISSVNFTDLIKFHNDNKASATMVVKQIKKTNPYGVIETNGILINNILEKPINEININAGIYVLSPRILKHLPNTKIDMTEFFLKLKKLKKKIIIYPVYENWIDIGIKKDFNKAKKKRI